MAQDLLLEIGTEEIPARFMEQTLKQMAQKAEQLFKDHRLSYQEINTYGTPRRLTLLVRGLAEKQEDLLEEAKGPSKQVAFDAQGNPTKAALGFARGRGVKVEDLVVKATPAGEYVFAIIRKEGEETIKVIGPLLKDYIEGLTFPKTMRWGSFKTRFVRPLRWLLALYGNTVIPVTIENITSGRVTYGHRFLAGGPVEITQPEEYLAKLEKAFVIADQQKRQRIIWEQIQQLAAAEGGRVEKDEDLLEEVTYLVEYPSALIGSFSSDYLTLPEEVLITPMREHQRYFPVRDSQGKLMPKFITVHNGTEEYIHIVREGNENVLRARLDDARFFYREDLKTSLSSRVERLKNVVYQEDLGTVYEKTERLQALAQYLAKTLSMSPEATEDAVRCAFLAKADLVTGMVYEFPELQGIMGAYYAAHDGEKETVSVGIREHYLPRFSGDQLPQSTVGTVVGIADKIDTIVGCFAVGIQPTGSQDPYALRRQALGICHIILDQELELSLSSLITESYLLYQQKIQPKLSLEQVREEVGQFFRQRIASILEEKGYSYDVVNAVLATGWEDPLDVYRRAQALSQFRQQAGFEALITAFNRAANLAQKAPTDQLQESLLVEPVEKELFRVFQSVYQRTNVQLAEGDYLGTLETLSTLRQPIDCFFNGVMVMVDDDAIRNNRLALLKQITDLTAKVADLSQIVM